MSFKKTQYGCVRINMTTYVKCPMSVLSHSRHNGTYAVVIITRSLYVSSVSQRIVVMECVMGMVAGWGPQCLVLNQCWGASSLVTQKYCVPNSTSNESKLLDSRDHLSHLCGLSIPSLIHSINIQTALMMSQVLRRHYR